MGFALELQRWRERQLAEYQHAQIIDRMDRQRLLGEYQQAQTTDQLSRQGEHLSRLAAILADVDDSLGIIESDIGRLLAVTDWALPAIVDHLALTSSRLASIERILASPKETEAWEQFRIGSHALRSAAQMAAKGADNLAADWLEESIRGLSRAIEIYEYRPEFWLHLGLAQARRGALEIAADAFARCARYAVEASPEMAAEAVLLAAAHFRAADRDADARAVLHNFLPLLERCAEVQLSLAMYHDEPDRLTRALELAPLLAATARAEGVTSVEAAAAEVCAQDDSPVARLRALEAAIRSLFEAAGVIGLDIGGSPSAVVLAEPGVDALLQAEVRISMVVEQARATVEAVEVALRQREAAVAAAHQRRKAALEAAERQRKAAIEAAQQPRQEALTSGAQRIAKARQIAATEVSPAQRVLEAARKQAPLFADKRLAEAHATIYDNHHHIRPKVMVELQSYWQSGKKWNNSGPPMVQAGVLLYEWYLHRGGGDGIAEFHRVMEWGKKYYRTVGRNWTQVPSAEMVLELLGHELRTSGLNRQVATELIRVSEVSLRQAEAEATLSVQLVEAEVKRDAQQAEAEVKRNVRQVWAETKRNVRQIESEFEEELRRSQVEKDSVTVGLRKQVDAMAAPLQAVRDTIVVASSRRDRIVPSVH
jgi:hypothetical protein